MKPKFMERTADCFRACVASILECEIEDILYPYEEGETDEMKYAAMEADLAKRFGVHIYFFSIDIQHLPAFLKNLHGYAMLGGMGETLPHIVVISTRGIVHNPDKDSKKFGSFADGTYQMGFVCKGVK